MNPLTASSLTRAEQETLLAVARRSVEHGLAEGRAIKVPVGEYPPALRERRASFVTLHRRGELCGCIGSLVARRPLVEDVASNAYAAGFEDRRFPSVTQNDLQDLTIHLSILHPAEPMSFTSEADLLGQLRPGEDGLILEESKPGFLCRRCRSTFLPAVWKTLLEREMFLQQLKIKAGLPADYWSDTLRVWRYTVDSIA